MQITQCPECHTAFKVSSEHLAVANGWVRCGRCGGVFEALLHLESEDTQEAQAANGHDQNAVVANAAAPSPSQPAASDIDAFHDSLLSFVPGGMRASKSSASDVNDQANGHANAAATAAKASEQVSAQPVWLWVLAALLTLTGLLQLVLWNRHVLVAQEPALQGLIEGLCAPIGCEWHWPQTLEAVQIENSSFTENADGTYRLQLRLKNTQHHAVAMPLLELTLTDERDEVVLRRVFQPQELGLKDHMPALRDARSTLNFDLDDNLKPRVMGFRALIFYP
ncbi:MAG: hypothetical protein RI902_2681 [Pseudomonadota bacterium]|jgi:predicted Zn finger-like uncharacterized protein